MGVPRGLSFDVGVISFDLCSRGGIQLLSGRGTDHRTKLVQSREDPVSRDPIMDGPDQVGSNQVRIQSREDPSKQGPIKWDPIK